MEPSRAPRIGAEAIQLFLRGVKLHSATQNETQLDHVRRIRDAVVRAVFHHAYEQRAVFTVTKNHHGGMRGKLADFVHHARADFEFAVDARSAHVDQKHVAPLAQFV